MTKNTFPVIEARVRKVVEVIVSKPGVGGNDCPGLEVLYYSTDGELLAVNDCIKDGKQAACNQFCGLSEGEVV